MLNKYINMFFTYKIINNYIDTLILIIFIIVNLSNIIYYL